MNLKKLVTDTRSFSTNSSDDLVFTPDLYKAYRFKDKSAASAYAEGVQGLYSDLKVRVESVVFDDDSVEYVLTFTDPDTHEFNYLF